MPSPTPPKSAKVELNVRDVKREFGKLCAEARLRRRHIGWIDIDPDDALDRRANQPLKTVASGAPNDGDRAWRMLSHRALQLVGEHPRLSDFRQGHMAFIVCQRDV